MHRIPSDPDVSLADDAARRAERIDEFSADLRLWLSPWVNSLPTSLRTTAEHVMAKPASFFDAEDVATHAKISRRHIDRLFQQCGLAPSKHLVVGCRAYVVVRILGLGESKIGVAAAVVGYDGQRGIRRHSEVIWNCAPRYACQLPLSQLKRGLLAYVTRNAPPA